MQSLRYEAPLVRNVATSSPRSCCLAKLKSRSTAYWTHLLLLLRRCCRSRLSTRACLRRSFRLGTELKVGRLLRAQLRVAIKVGLGRPTLRNGDETAGCGPDGAIQGRRRLGECVKTTITRRCAVRAGFGMALKQGWARARTQTTQGSDVYTSRDMHMAGLKSKVKTKKYRRLRVRDP